MNDRVQSGVIVSVDTEPEPARAEVRVAEFPSGESCADHLTSHDLRAIAGVLCNVAAEMDEIRSIRQ